MSGTIVVNENNSFDVRTIDFVRIVDLLRTHAGTSSIEAKLLEAVDEFGMNVICADALSPMELSGFLHLLMKVGDSIGTDEKGLADFLNSVCLSIQEDHRLSANRA